MHKITYLNIIVSALVYAILSTGINAKTLDRIVAVVEEDVITESELQQRVGALVKQYDKNRGALPPQDVLIEQVLQRLIVERLQIQLAERRGIQIDDLSLDQAMRNLAKRNNLSLEDFRNELVKQGHDYAAFRDQVRNEMLLDQLRRRTIDQGVEVTDSEIEDLVKKSDEDLLKKDYEYHLAHILIALPENPQAEQLEKLKYRASSVYERASAGNNFAQLAIAASDAQDALQGGDLGWRSKAQIPPVYLQQLQNMVPGDVSKIAQSQSGLHIFKVLDRREVKDTMVNQVLCRHILIHTNALLDDAAANIKLKDIKSRIERGEDFGEFAREFSDDTGSAANGGNLNWSTTNNFVPKFQEIVDGMQVKQISEPFQSRFGWHIVELLDTRKHDNTGEAMRAEAREQIRQRKIEEETEQWLRQLRDESYIEIRLHTSN